MDCGGDASRSKAGCCCGWLLLSNAAFGCCCWLLLLVAAFGCCCWLLLLVAAVDCCCWLLLLMAAAGGCCWLLLLVAAVDGCCWLLLLVAAVDCCCWLLLLVAQKVFEYFRNIVDYLRLRQICRRKSLWIISGCWYFAAKTNLQAKKSLNIFGCWWKVFEYFRIVVEESLNIFQNIGERKVEESFASGKLVVNSSKRMNILAVHWVFILDTSKMANVWARANQIIWWELESRKVGSVKLAAKTSFEVVLE